MNHVKNALIEAEKCVMFYILKNYLHNKYKWFQKVEPNIGKATMFCRTNSKDFALMSIFFRDKD